MTAAGIRELAREQTRARYPDEEGYVERDGIRVFWERYGEGHGAHARDPVRVNLLIREFVESLP